MVYLHSHHSTAYIYNIEVHLRWSSRTGIACIQQIPSLFVLVLRSSPSFQTISPQSIPARRLVPTLTLFRPSSEPLHTNHPTQKTPKHISRPCLFILKFLGPPNPEFYTPIYALIPSRAINSPCLVRSLEHCCVYIRKVHGFVFSLYTLR